MSPYWVQILKRVVVSKILAKVLVPICAIWGKYPAMFVTPDDPVSPFGKDEPTMVSIYQRFGRWAGDVVWLAWRNAGYGYAYSQKPDWLKDPSIDYIDLIVNKVEEGWKTTYNVLSPDGQELLQERQYKVGPIIVIAGHRIQPIYDGAMRNRKQRAQNLPYPKLPAKHPNMDGRPILSIRTTRTM